jgi:nicotinamidase-related amidase
MNQKTALVIVDLQQGMFTLPDPLYRGDQLLRTLSDLVERARQSGTPVVYLQHDGSEGHPLAPSTPGWPIHPAVAPNENDIVVRKQHCDAFCETRLETTLKELQVTRLVVAGLQTEYCVDTTCRRAFSLGYQVVLVGDGHSTCDTESLKASAVIAHHNQVLGEVFATVQAAHEITF